jgi:flagellar biosynthesis/type III secretory pathway chaperone
MPDLDFNTLLENLKFEAEKYNQLLQLSKHQDEIINNSDVEPIMHIAGRKNRILNEIEQIDKQIAPFKNNWQEVKSQFTPQQAKQIEDILTLISNYLLEILQYEEKHIGILSQRKDHTSSQVHELLKRRKALRTYIPLPKSSGRQINKKD